MNCQVAYRSNKLLGSSSESENDSDNDCDVWKRSSSNKHSDADIKPPEATQLQATSVVGGATRKRRINNVWSSVLEEEGVVSELCQIGLKSKPVDRQDRSCENYDYRLKYTDPRRELDMEMDDESSDDVGESDEIGEQSSECHTFKKIRRTGSSLESLDGHRDDGKKRFKKNKVDNGAGRFPKLSPSDTEVARKIVRSLGERKHYLIYRVVHIIGAEKAMKLLKMTEDIEEQGGMLIKNNTRRRTPGGVYLQLLKAETGVTSEQVDQIFAHEIPYEKLKELRKQQKKLLKESGQLKRKKKKKNKGKSEVDSMKVEDVAPAEADAGISECMQAASSPACDKVQIANTLVAAEEKVDIGDSDIEDGEIVDT